MKIKVVSRKLIKPCTPTPPNLNKYRISFKDELIAPLNVGIVFFYKTSRLTIISLQLQESLSQTLAQFYPLAGRYINKDRTVDCSDQGAEFVEAEVADEIELDDVLNSGRLEELLARRCDLADGANDPLLSIQVTEFIRCESIAVGVSVSHRIFDGSSIGTFIAAWANANTKKCTIFPSFESLVLFPVQQHSLLLFPGKNLNIPVNLERSQARIVTKRLLFKKETLMTLRSKLKPKNDAHNALSRVRIVCAVIAEALIRVDQRKHQHSRSCCMMQSVDMRHRTIPPLPKHSCGNLVLHATTETIPSATDLSVEDIALALTDAIVKKVSDCVELFSVGEDRRNQIIVEHELDSIVRSKICNLNYMSFTDWTKFGLYGVDFGWGKPVLVGVATLPVEKLIVLVNSNNGDGDGIEAWVHLNTDDMSYFEQDEGIKFFIS